METQKQIESNLRSVQAMETIAESLRSIAQKFSQIVDIIEEEYKEDQALRKMNKHLKF